MDLYASLFLHSSSLILRALTIILDDLAQRPTSYFLAHPIPSDAYLYFSPSLNSPDDLRAAGRTEPHSTFKNMPDYTLGDYPTFVSGNVYHHQELVFGTFQGELPV